MYGTIFETRNRKDAYYWQACILRQKGAQPITRFIRSKLLRDMGDDWPPVQYNTWYADYEKLSEETFIKAAGVAAELGCELFTVDAGWYGTQHNWSMLGDWSVNREKFPNGLEPVVQEVRKLGMKFGLWVEIENVTPDSPLGKEHPDWFLRDGDRMLNNRATLNFGNPEALAWARSIIDKLMADYQLDYIKMDYNCDPAVNKGLPVKFGHKGASVVITIASEDSTSGISN